MDDIAVEVGATVVISSGNCTLTSKDGYDDEMTTFTIVVRLFTYAAAMLCILEVSIVKLQKNIENLNNDTFFYF